MTAQTDPATARRPAPDAGAATRLTVGGWARRRRSCSSGCVSNASQDSLKAHGLRRPASSTPCSSRSSGSPSASSPSSPAWSAYAVIRFRARSDDEAPKQIHGNTKLEITWTILPALLLAGIAIPTVKMVFDINTVPQERHDDQRTGHRWWWQYRTTRARPTPPDLFRRPTSCTSRSGEKVVAHADLGRRHPQLLGPGAGRQDLRHPRPAQPAGHRSRPPRAPTRPVRRVLRDVARQHALPGRRPDARPTSQTWVVPAGAGSPADTAPRPRRNAASRRLAPCSASGGCSGCHTISGTSERRGRTQPDPLQEPLGVRRLPSSPTTTTTSGRWLPTRQARSRARSCPTSTCRRTTSQADRLPGHPAMTDPPDGVD